MNSAQFIILEMIPRYILSHFAFPHHRKIINFDPKLTKIDYFQFFSQKFQASYLNGNYTCRCSTLPPIIIQKNIIGLVSRKKNIWVQNKALMRHYSLRKNNFAIFLKFRFFREPLFKLLILIFKINQSDWSERKETTN